MNLLSQKIRCTLALIVFTIHLSLAQFHGPAGVAGTSAMHKDSSAFVNWASACTVTRGYQDIAVPSGGYANIGTDINGTGKAGVNSVVSLGDAGFAILTFPTPIVNGNGFDFAVFENSFADDYLELAFVEVSSDGVNYFRFPASSSTQTLTQIGPFDALGDATKLNNLAGKYRANYGTPFDLQELSGQSGLNVNAITHVKITDVVGSINSLYSTKDKNNVSINDPYPTAFGSGGFDLDAVGVINQLQAVGIDSKRTNQSVAFVYPNPAGEIIYVIGTQQIQLLELANCQGSIIKQSLTEELLISELEKGIYFLKITFNDGLSCTKKIIKE